MERKDVTLKLTRIHSIKMRTVRSSSFCQECLLLVWGCVSSWSRGLSALGPRVSAFGWGGSLLFVGGGEGLLLVCGGVCFWSRWVCYWSQGMSAPGPGWVVVYSNMQRAKPLPPRRRQTHRCKNITLIRSLRTVIRSTNNLV